MKGLLIKDLLNLKKQGKIIAALAVFYIILSISLGEASMLIGMVVILCTLMPVTAFSYDELSKWDKYALSMPISRKNIVVSKYILGLILNIAGSIFILIFSFISTFFIKELVVSDIPLTIYTTSIAGLLILSLWFPFIFKFGVESARMILIVIVAIPFAGVFILPKLGVTLPSVDSIEGLLWVSPIIIAVVFLLSMAISINIYNKREF